MRHFSLVFRAFQKSIHLERIIGGEVAEQDMSRGLMSGGMQQNWEGCLLGHRTRTTEREPGKRENYEFGFEWVNASAKGARGRKKVLIGATLTCQLPWRRGTSE